MWNTSKMETQKILFCFVGLFLSSVSSEGSLTFVVDDTASMARTIKFVKNAIKSINESFSDMNYIKETILVTFNDRGVKIHEISNIYEIDKNLMMHVGGDCSAISLSGIQVALNASQFGSYLYVFTDAAPKDEELTDDVIKLCSEKNSQVSFVVIEDRTCKQFNKTLKPYHEIAHACSGQIFYLRDRDDIEWIIPYVQEIISGLNDKITSKSVKPKVWTKIPFTIDEISDYGIVSLSGDLVDIQLDGSNGSLKPVESYEAITDIKTIKVLKVYNPGQYVAKVYALGLASFVVFGRTNFTYHYGFSEFTPKSLDETSRQPTSGFLFYLSFFVDDPQNIGEVLSADLLNMNNTPIKENIQLKNIGYNTYITGQSIIPDDMFKIALNVKVTKTGKIVKRIAEVPVRPKRSEGINFNLPDGIINVLVGKPLTIIPAAPFIPKGILKWYKTVEIQKTSTPQPRESHKPQLIQEGSDQYFIEKTKFTDDGLYTVKDELTGNTWDVEVVVGTKPEFVYKSVKENVIWDGSSQYLNCEATAKPQASIQWYEYKDRKTIKRGYSNTLKVSGWGIYYCTIFNVHGSLLRSFRVTSKDCLLNRYEATKMNMPMLLEPITKSWASLDYIEEFLIIPANKTLLLSCGKNNVFTKYYDTNEITAVCVKDDIYNVDGRQVKFSELYCKNSIKPKLLNTNDTCSSNEKAKIVRVGLEANEFIDTYRLCIDTRNNLTLYAENNITNTKYMSGKDYVPDNNVVIYGSSKIHENVTDYYTGQLVNARNVLFGPAHMTTSLDKNQVLIHVPVNMTTWNDIEDAIRTAALTSQSKWLNVKTGVSNVTIIKEGKMLPRLLWKVVENENDSETIAIIFINGPDPKEEDKKCSDSCLTRIGFNPSRNIYCCTLEHFKETIAL